MDFNKYFVDIIKHKYLDFATRAPRKEYWMFCLWSFIISIALSILDSILGFRINSGFDSETGILSGLFSLAIFVPSIALGVRRLHDIGKSGWWLLLWLLPIIGWIMMIVYLVRDSEPGSNAYGANPKGVNSMTPPASPAAPTPPPVVPAL